MGLNILGPQKTKISFTPQEQEVPVAVVTGASRGLGRQLALTLHKCGYCVAVNYNHSEKEAYETAGLIGERAMPVQADVGNPGQVKIMAEKVYTKWGRIDALINNAGISADGVLIKYKEKEWDKVINVNLKGCFNTVRSFAPLMIKSGKGHIVNISSYSGLRGKAGQPAYSASKAALIGLTCSLALELAEYNIMVNSVLPGYMPTAMGGKTAGAMEKAGKDSLLKRLSDPEETAAFIAYLLTTGSITGQIFRLDSRI